MMAKIKRELSLPVADVRQAKAQLQIKNFDDLKKVAIQIDKKFSQMSVHSDRYTHKDIFNARRSLNRLNRNLNKLRLKYKRVYMEPYKGFKGQVDTLRGYIGDASKKLSKCLKNEKATKQKALKKRLQPKMTQICLSYHVPNTEVPDDCLKMSLSNTKRVSIMTGVAETKQREAKMASAIPDKHGNAIVKSTGEKIGIARSLEFMGDKLQLHGLLDFAKKNGIHLTINK